MPEAGRKEEARQSDAAAAAEDRGEGERGGGDESPDTPGRPPQEEPPAKRRCTRPEAHSEPQADEGIPSAKRRRLRWKQSAPGYPEPAGVGEAAAAGSEQGSGQQVQRQGDAAPGPEPQPQGHDDAGGAYRGAGRKRERRGGAARAGRPTAAQLRAEAAARGSREDSTFPGGGDVCAGRVHQSHRMVKCQVTNLPVCQRCGAWTKGAVLRKLQQECSRPTASGARVLDRLARGKGLRLTAG